MKPSLNYLKNVDDIVVNLLIMLLCRGFQGGKIPLHQAIEVTQDQVPAWLPGPRLGQQQMPAAQQLAGNNVTLALRCWLSMPAEASKGKIAVLSSFLGPAAGASCRPISGKHRARSDCTAA